MFWAPKTGLGVHGVIEEGFESFTASDACVEDGDALHAIPPATSGVMNAR